MTVPRFAAGLLVVLATCVSDKPPAAGQCSFVGAWAGTYSCPALNGVSYNWVVRADGTATGTIGGSYNVRQTWSLSGSNRYIAETVACVGVQVSSTLLFD